MRFESFLKCLLILVVPGSALPAPGDLDPSLNQSPNQAVYTALQQPDGRIAMAGLFNLVGGIPRQTLTRVNTDGTTEDQNFSFVGFTSQAVYGLSVQANHDVMFGGYFDYIGETRPSGLAKMTEAGNYVVEFAPTVGEMFTVPTVDRTVYASVAQPDGRILLAGDFPLVNRVARSRIARLNANGSLDPDFNPTVNNIIYSLALQPDGKILLAGLFTTVNGTTRNRLARLNTDGTLDPGFNPNTDAIVYCLAVQPDGRILVGGGFSNIGAIGRKSMARLGMDGAVDPGFNPNVNQPVTSISLQADGKMFMGGLFTTVGGTAASRLARLNPDGTLDGGFPVNVSGGVYGTMLQADGKILISGGFANVNQTSRLFIARLENDPASQALTTPAFNRIQWLRGGASPEAFRVAFQASTDDAASWTELGIGTRIPGGWELTGRGLPPGGKVRAQAFCSGGYLNSSTELVETITPFSGFAVPEFDLLGNSIPIVSGDTLASIDDHSYFGSAAVVGGTITRTFIINNNGDEVLRLTAAPMITISGSEAADFIVTTPPSATVAPHASTSFQVRFDPRSLGVRSAKISITSDDFDEPIYEFAIQGTGIGVAPEIGVSGNGAPIPSGSTPPISSNHTDFGPAAYPNGIIVRTFAIANSGTGALLLYGSPRVTISGTQAAEFIVTRPPAATVDLAVTTFFDVTFRPQAPGLRSAVVSIQNDDGDENPYTFLIQGQGMALGSPDPNFTGTNIGFTPAVQPDGKIISGRSPYNTLYRLQTNGSVDPSFAAAVSGDQGAVRYVLVQKDGKICITGSFTSVNGSPRSHIARLNANGSLDPSFNPNLSAPNVSCMTIQDDGRLIIGGSFTSVGGLTRNRLARLHADGSVDASFAPNIDNTVIQALVQGDGKILIGGWFTKVGLDSRKYLARLNADGSLDTTFDPSPNAELYSMALQPDGKVLIAGSFTSAGAAVRNRIARILPNGTADPAFNPNMDDTVYAVNYQADGNIWVGGKFTTVGGVARTAMARFSPNGSLDPIFNPTFAVYASVNAIGIQPDGNLIVLGGYPEKTRLLNDSAIEQLSITAPNRIEWLRGGGGPGISGCYFESSTDGGSTWDFLGRGSRITGGWELKGRGLPASGRVRALGLTHTQGSASHVTSMVEFNRLLIPEIGLTGNGLDIVNGDDSPDLASGTEFGNLSVIGASSTQSFSIANSGPGLLSLTGPPFITITGPQAPDFTVTAPPAANMASGAASTFQVTFNPRGLGSRTATISITSDDYDEPVFSFVVHGTGTGLTPEVAALGNALEITSGDTTPSLLDHTDFGQEASTTGIANRVFTIANHGTSALNLTSSPIIAITGAQASEFTVTSMPAVLINAGEVSTFSIEFRPLATGLRTAQISFANNDDESPFAFAIQGIGYLPGQVDVSFNPGVNGTVRTAVPQPDGKILVAGSFSSLGGTLRNCVGRLNADGSVDPGFDPNITGGTVYNITVMPDGSLLCGGLFNMAAGQVRSNLVKLQGTGVLDAGFAPNPNGVVYSVALQKDGKWLVGGGFTSIGGLPSSRLARFHANGTLDASFAPEFSDTVYGCVVQEDGKILVGGAFSTVGGVARSRLARLLPDGTLDPTFGNPTFSSTVLSLVVQPDGKVLVGGEFSTVSGVARNNFARLNADGSLDTSFNARLNGSHRTTSVQADGKIIVGGYFTTVAGVTRNRVARLNPDGSLDTSFNVGTNDIVYCTAQQADGRIILGGVFTTVDGLARSGLARLNNGPAPSSLSIPLFNHVLWLRGGSAPESLLTSIELSTDAGNSWTLLGGGTRISGGWELGGIALPSSGQLRARARTTSGYANGSGGWVEDAIEFNGLSTPEISLLGNNLAITNGDNSPSSMDGTDFGEAEVRGGLVTASFVVVNSGTEPLTLTSPTRVEISGINAGDFSVTLPPAGTVMPGTGSNFEITFDPRGLGLRTAIVTLRSDDSDESEYTFALAGTGIGLVPEIEVTGNGLTIANGDSLPTSADNTDLGSVISSDLSHTEREFFITNTGTAALTLTGTPKVVVAGLHPGDFTVTLNPAASLAVGDSSTFQITFDPQAPGLRSAIIRIASDDDDESAYEFAIRGTGLPPGSLDEDFIPAVSGISNMLVQPDEQIVISGNFTNVGGIPRNRIARLTASGALDPDFNPNVSAILSTMALQGDGKIILGGALFQVGNTGPNTYLARIHADGWPDTSFVSLPDKRVAIATLQPDGKIIVGGEFTQINGVPRNFLARLNDDGSVDPSFDPNPNGIVTGSTMMPDGSIFITGSFTQINGIACSRLAKLSPDGQPDPTFLNYFPANNQLPYGVTAQPDGKVIVWGSFTSAAGSARNNIARFLADGTLDPAFNPNAGGIVTSCILQADRKVLVIGQFTLLGGVGRRNTARLNPDGTLDPDFNPNPDGLLDSAAIQADGKILITGSFRNIGGKPRTSFARLQNDSAANLLTAPSFNHLRWQYDGGAPEVEFAAFESSTDGGVNWSALGNGFRTNDGWELTDRGLPATGQIRVNGRVRSGNKSTATGLIRAQASFQNFTIPEMDVSGNGVSITDGSVDPIADNHTDFGEALVQDGTVVRNFTVSNQGGERLTLTGTPPVKVTGPNAAEFVVTSVPATSVAGSGQTIFQITFKTQSVGPRSATLTIASDDFDEPAYSFKVRGTGTGTVPEIELMGNGRDIANQDQTPNPLDGTHFAATGIQAGEVRHAFTIRNSGNAVLHLTGTPGIALSGTHSAEFRVIAAPAVNVAPGATAPFEITFLPAGPGLRSATVSINSNDDDEAPLQFSIAGFGLAMGDADPYFNPNPGGGLSSTNIDSVVQQPDGKLLVCGSFTSIQGGQRSYLARLEQDGSLDRNFLPLLDNSVSAVAVQADGQIVIAGAFTTVSGTTRRHVARLRADGSLDPTFDPAANQIVFALAIQPDGKILLGGGFTHIGVVPRFLVARLNADGSLDTSFNPGLTANGSIYVSGFALQPDGKLLITGQIQVVNFIVGFGILRLNANGSIDSQFSTANSGQGITFATLQPDGKILVSGTFTQLYGTPLTNLARLNPDGSLDAAFHPNPNGSINRCLLQADGKIIISGNFTQVGGQPRNGLTRLNPDGSVDLASSAAYVGSSINGIAIQADGKLVVGGTFTSVGGLPRRQLARIENGTPVDHLFATSPQRLKWLRGGTVPEALNVVFDYSNNGGTSWTTLGSGTRFAGSWELGGLNLAASGVIRSRAQVGQNPTTVWESRLTYNGYVEIVVSGNGQIIAQNDTLPTLNDFTGFGSTEVRGGSVTRTFTITNSGASALLLFGRPSVALSGPNAGDFTITSPPSDVIEGSSQTTFDVTFDPHALGLRSALITIENNDDDEAPFQFAIHGQGTGLVPNIALLGNGSIITNGDSTPSLADFTDFGKLLTDNGTLVRSFSIANQGTLDLTLTGSPSVRIEGTNAADFLIVTQPAGAIPVNGVVSIEVQFNPGASGLRTATLRITSDDDDEPSYTVALQGTGYMPGDFDSGVLMNYGAFVRSIAVQPDGKTVIGGKFTSLAGVPRRHLARYHADGSLDVNFTPEVDIATNQDSFISVLAIQPDGKILIYGNFTTINGTARSRFARLNPDGSLDTTFTADLDQFFARMALQPDGKILLVGDFTTVRGVTRNGIARLNADGTLDTAFNPNANSWVTALALQPDGRIIIGGAFTTIGSIAQSYLARLKPDGSVDPSFTVNPGAVVQCAALQPDGKILLGGRFPGYVTRLESTGTTDATFSAFAENWINNLVLQTDGKILITGDFLKVNSVQRNYLARLNGDGTVDLRFNANADTGIGGLAVDPNGKILMGGGYQSIGISQRPTFSRLENDPGGSMLNILDFHHLEWLRSGTAPESPYTTFELSTNGGSSWTFLGSGSRINGGWGLAGLTLPASGDLRARARTMGGAWNDNGLLETRISFTDLPVPNIEIISNDRVIVNGDTSPSVEDQTDFGSGEAGLDIVQRSFTLKNVGRDTLTLTGTPRISISGANASDYTITTQPAASVPAANQTTFLVSFTPRGIGTRSATLRVDSDDFDDRTFEFKIQGIGTTTRALPEMDVTGNGLPIANGDNAPTFADDTDFGSVALAGGILTRTFTILNSGQSALALTGTPRVAISGPHAIDFSLGTAPPSSLPVGGRATFQILFDPSVRGLRSAVVTVASDDLDEGLYAFSIQGTGILPGEVDALFDTVGSGTVNSTSPYFDGGLITGGTFTNLDGTPRNRLGRLLADGSLEAVFNPNSNGTVTCTAIQGDGKILVAGGFSSMGGVSRNRLARLNANGSLDTTFNPNVSATAVNGILVQPDGKLVLGGTFTTVGGVARNNIARINADGTLDTGFNPNAGAAVNSVALQPDGKIVMGGAFATVGGVARADVARINPDGSLDTTFNPTANGTVNCVLVQPDGKIVIGGAFTNLVGVVRNRLARVNADGSLETGFNPNSSSTINSVALQADGKLIVGGAFSTIGGAARSRIARITSVGALDPDFNPNASATVNAVTLQPDGKVVIGGTFTTVGGIARTSIARLENDLALQSLTLPGTDRVQWLRGGAAPEISQVTFDSSNNGGATWTALGQGTRIAGGWELTGLNLTPNLQIRARARSGGGQFNGSSGVLESITANAPDISVESPLDSPLTDQLANIPFGTATVGGSPQVKSFTIRNPGNATLILGTITSDGDHPNDFLIGTPSSSIILPGGTSTFTVTFAPGAGGPRSATLHIPSNVPGSTNPFDISVAGSGNLPPVFTGYAVKGKKGASVSIGAAKILSRVSDADGGTPVISNIANTSAQGGTVSMGANTVNYAPPANFIGLDTFAITFSDGQGGSTPGTITVDVKNGNSSVTGNQASISLQPNGVVAVLFHGIPGQTYIIQRSSDLQTWADLLTTTAAPDGTLPFTDSSPPTGTAFYRTAVP